MEVEVGQKMVGASALLKHVHITTAQLTPWN